MLAEPFAREGGDSAECANLIELGVTLTADPRRAEVSFDRAFALI